MTVIKNNIRHQGCQFTMLHFLTQSLRRGNISKCDIKEYASLSKYPFLMLSNWRKLDHGI